MTSLNIVSVQYQDSGKVAEAQNIIKLGGIADVRSGHSFRSRIEADLEGDVVVFQIKGLSQKGLVDPEDGVPVYFPEVRESSLLRRGDVLMAARGLRNVAGVVDFEPGRAVASGQLLWVRLTNDAVDPAYLAWYLNQRPAQVYLGQRRRGTHVPIVTRRTAVDIPVVVPPLKTQKLFVELEALRRRREAVDRGDPHEARTVV